MLTEDLHEAPKYCLVTLSNEEIVQKWEQISPLVACSLPPIVNSNPELMSRFLTATQTGAIELHVLGTEGQRLSPLALVGTMIFNDGFSGTRNLVIVCLTALEELNKPDIWSKGMDLLKHVARLRNCSAILAYSNVRSIIELVKSLGGSAEFTLLKIGV